MRKFYLISAILIIALISPAFFSNTTNAQMTYTVDTLLKKPKSNTLMINIGGQADWGLTPGDAAAGIYVHGRYKIGEILQASATAAMLPIQSANMPQASYLIIEANGCFYFKSEVKNANSTIKLGGGKNSSGQPVKFSANVPTASWQQMGITAGVFNWSRPLTRKEGDSSYTFIAKNSVNDSIYKGSEVYTNLNVTGISFGFAVSMNSKSKYKFNTNYGTKIRRVNTTIDMGMEILFAPMVSYKEKVDVIDKNDVKTTYNISELDKKRIGFRIRAEIRQKIFSFRTEIGLRPGVKYAYEDKKGLAGAYYLLGIGIGIGAM